MAHQLCAPTSLYLAVSLHMQCRGVGDAFSTSGSQDAKASLIIHGAYEGSNVCQSTLKMCVLGVEVKGVGGAERVIEKKGKHGGNDRVVDLQESEESYVTRVQLEEGKITECMTQRSRGAAVLNVALDSSGI